MAPPRPLGTITRGTTHPNRLRRVDRWIAHALEEYPHRLRYRTRAAYTGA